MSDDFEKSIAELANTIVEKTTEDGRTLQETVDAFKALTTYYALLKRYRQSNDPGDDEEEPSIATLTRDIEVAENGGDSSQNIRSRRRRTGIAGNDPYSQN